MYTHTSRPQPGTAVCHTSQRSNVRYENSTPRPCCACQSSTSYFWPRPANPYLCRKPLRQHSQPEHAPQRTYKRCCQPSSVQQQARPLPCDSFACLLRHAHHLSILFQEVFREAEGDSSHDAEATYRSGLHACQAAVQQTFSSSNPSHS